MNRLDHDVNYKWHVALNKYNQVGKDFKYWMYEAKHLADELPRLTLLFARERLGQLPALHRQCSHSPTRPITDNHLTCCLGCECRKCPMLLALEAAELEPETIDELKAWTCCAHIITETGKGLVDTSEGYIKTVGDQMFWDTLYDSLSGGLK